MFANWYAQRWSPNLENWINPFVLCLNHSDAQGENGMYSMSAPPVIVVANNNQSVQFSHSVVTDSLWRYGQQHARLIHVHPVNDAIQPSHPLLSPSPPAFNL